MQLTIDFRTRLMFPWCLGREFVCIVPIFTAGLLGGGGLASGFPSCFCDLACKAEVECLVKLRSLFPRGDVRHRTPPPTATREAKHQISLGIALSSIDQSWPRRVLVSLAIGLLPGVSLVNTESREGSCWQAMPWHCITRSCPTIFGLDRNLNT